MSSDHPFFDDERPDGDDDDLFGFGSGDEESDPTEEEVERLCREGLERLEEGDSEAAREAAAEAVTLDPDHPFPQFVLALVADQEGDDVAARYLSDNALRGAPTNGDTIQFRALLHVRDHEFDKAEALLRGGIVHNPDDASLIESLARVCMGTGKHEEALRSAEAALRLEPLSEGARSIRMAILDASRDPETMLAVLRQAVQMHPDDPQPMLELAAMEVEIGNVERARRLLDRAHRLAPRDSQIADIRVMVDGAYAPIGLRPLPKLLSWLREFPGGLVGFLLGLVVAALPLGALAEAGTGYAPIAGAVLLVWGLTAMYAWVGPPLLAARLDAGAAFIAEERLRAEARETSHETGEARSIINVDRVADAASLLVEARSWRRLRALMSFASRTESRDDVREALQTTNERVRTVPSRTLQLLTCIPADTRLLVGTAAAISVTAPPLGRQLDVHPGWIWAAAFGLLLMALALVHAHLSVARVVEQGLAAASETAAGAALPTMNDDIASLTAEFERERDKILEAFDRLGGVGMEENLDELTPPAAAAEVDADSTDRASNRSSDPRDDAGPSSDGSAPADPST
jgi:Flp pilus assembly protein TadD